MPACYKPVIQQIGPFSQETVVWAGSAHTDYPAALACDKQVC